MKVIRCNLKLTRYLAVLLNDDNYLQAWNLATYFLKTKLIALFSQRSFYSLFFSDLSILILLSRQSTGSGISKGMAGGEHKRLSY